MDYRAATPLLFLLDDSGEENDNMEHDSRRPSRHRGCLRCTNKSDLGSRKSSNRLDEDYPNLRAVGIIAFESLFDFCLFEKIGTSTCIHLL